jgi:hypothetical protein
LIFRKNGGFSYLLGTAYQPILKLTKLPSLIHPQKTVFSFPAALAVPKTSPGITGFILPGEVMVRIGCITLTNNIGGVK